MNKPEEFKTKQLFLYCIKTTGIITINSEILVTKETPVNEHEMITKPLIYINHKRISTKELKGLTSENENFV